MIDLDTLIAKAQAVAAMPPSANISIAQPPHVLVHARDLVALAVAVKAAQALCKGDGMYAPSDEMWEAFGAALAPFTAGKDTP